MADADAEDERANATESTSTGSDVCPNHVGLATVEFLVPIVVLILFNLVVIIGNVLVIAAVVTHKKLRTATNAFIMSLAVADLMLGVTVLPFSSANEVLRYWPFGTIWCSVWLAVDVWMCTASILNLCAISMDRYLAITRPFKYPRLMSHFRARILVASVWVVSFLICFPPLIGWNERGMGLGESGGASGSDNGSVANGNETAVPAAGDTVVYQVLDFGNAIRNTSEASYSTAGAHAPDSSPGSPDCEQGIVCALTSEPGYIIYSACGSFWIPVWIMAFFYWRIYKTAVKTTSALKRGVLTTKGKGNLQASGSPNSETPVTLRVHRGGGGGSGASFKTTRSPSDDCSSMHGAGRRKHSRGQSTRDPTRRRSDQVETQLSTSSRHSNPPRRESSTSSGKNGFFAGKNKRPKIRITFSRSDPETLENVSRDGERLPLRPNRSTTGFEPLTPPPKHVQVVQNGSRARIESLGLDETTVGTMEESSTETRSSGFINKVGKMHLKTHIKRINKEKKAAKTVGIIVGGFILCWAPFFTVYLLGAFCPHCTPNIVFTIFFWLGYCNSAVNPCVYALCSRDFRYAFKKLIRCRVERKRPSERTGTRLMSLMNSIRLQISSKGSDSNSE